MNDPNAAETAKRAYQLQNIEKQQLGVQSSGNVPSPIRPAATIANVADLFAAVKQYDSDFKPNQPSKAANSDGIPLMVYHGTNARFDTFVSQSGVYWFSAYEDYAEAMMEERGGGEITDFLGLAEKIKAVYAGLKPDSAEARYVLQMKESIDQLAQLFAEGVMAEKAEKSTAESSGATVRHSVRKSFAGELQDWFDSTTHEERKVSGKRFLVGTTTDVLKSIGVKDYEIYFGGSKIDKILENNTSMSLDTIKQAVQLLEDPILIMQSRTVADSIVLFGEVYTEGDKPVMISVLLNPRAKTGEILDYAVITSTYGRRSSNVQNLINSSTIYYVNENKNRTENWLQALGLQLPSAITKFGSISSISNPEGEVNQKFSRRKKSEADESSGVKQQTRKGMTESEISGIQGIGRKSVNAFSSQDIQVTEGLAKRYWSEMGAKSPFFRAWFGDWRLNDRTPVQVATQKGDTRGVQHNEDTGWDIQVSGQVFNETKSHRGLANKHAQPYLPYINDIVRKAVLLDSYGIGTGKAKSENSLLMHSMYAVADIGNGPEVLKLYIEEMNNPASNLTTKRSYQLQNIEKAFNASVRVQGQTPSSLTSTLNTIKIVADLFAAVKQYDSAFNPHPPSKAVNSDGMPLVVYHGTNAQFNTFAAKSGAYWFSAYEDYAEAMMEERGGGEVKACYLNMRNPYYAKLKPGQFSDPSYEAGILQSARAGGHDGVIIENDTTNPIEADCFYVVFDNKQIKSVTDNVGTFDSSNPDIRYSRRKKSEAEVLQAQNEKLREDVERLKELVKLQGKVTHGSVFNASSVEAAARYLKKLFHTEGDTKELAKLLDGLYRYIASDPELTWEGVKEQAAHIVD